MLITWGLVQDFLKLRKAAPVGDLIDKINSSIVPAIISLFCFMISAKQWVGSPIQCWLPKEFASSWNQYAEDYCFIHETYYAPVDDRTKISPEHKRENSAGYYQWVPIFLILSALGFYLPFVCYQRLLRKKAGLDVQKWVEESIELKNAKLKDRDQHVKALANEYHKQLQAKSVKNRTLDAVTAYLILKVVFCLNLIVQIYQMNVFLGHDTLWAVWSLFGMYEGKDWTYQGFFPRVTFCDFRIRDLGNIRPYSVQCVLMINMFNEKVYLFLWSLYVILFVATAANLFLTVFNHFTPATTTNYLRGMLEDSDPQKMTVTLDDDEDRDMEEKKIPNGKQVEKKAAEQDPRVLFTDENIDDYCKYLGREGVLAIRLIEAHSDRRLCTLLNRALFNKMIDEVPRKRKNETKDEKRDFPDNPRYQLFPVSAEKKIGDMV
ncbi:unnamed protein product, partial [Mesorhabditis belari]|uniref:Innexin n=1 Tax=Mesorhabditis belari TaxID=2138241 RepID=A0AAF3EFC8_9BILA